jgi:hypothetical protein
MTSLCLGLCFALSLCTDVRQTPDFSGRWKLIEQETSAWRGRSGIGGHEEDLVIIQSAASLSVHYEPGDGRWDFAYRLMDSGPKPSGDVEWTSSRWEGRSLVTAGRRSFRAGDGSEAYDFEETRTVSADGGRMTVVTRIEMFPKDLVRTTVYERLERRAAESRPADSR